MKIKHSGSIITSGSGSNTKYLDQLSDDDIWIGAYRIRKYLMDKYGLSPKDYYNLVVYGDINHIEYCSVCGKPTAFDRLSAGYRTSCSRGCSAVLGGNAIAPAMRDPNSKCKLACKEKLKELFSDGTHPFTSVEVHARSRMTDFINKGDPDKESWFYVAISNDDRIKFGITDDPVAYNANKCIYQKIHPLIKGTRKSVAYLEYSYKVHFNSRIEYFSKDKYSEMLEWIIKFSNNNNLGTFNDYPDWE